MSRLGYFTTCFCSLLHSLFRVSLTVMFNSTKLKLTMISNRRKCKSLHMRSWEPVNIQHLCLIKYWNNPLFVNRVETFHFSTEHKCSKFCSGAVLNYLMMFWNVMRERTFWTECGDRWKIKRSPQLTGFNLWGSWTSCHANLFIWYLLTIWNVSLMFSKEQRIMFWGLWLAANACAIW